MNNPIIIEFNGSILNIDPNPWQGATYINKIRLEKENEFLIMQGQHSNLAYCLSVSNYYSLDKSTFTFSGGGHPVLIHNGHNYNLKNTSYPNGFQSLVSFNDVQYKKYVNILIRKLNKIDFENNTVNIQNLKELLGCRDELLSIYHAGLIKLTEKEYIELLDLEVNAILNMPHIFLLWSNLPASNINEGNPFVNLPNNLLYNIFDYVGFDNDGINFKFPERVSDITELIGCFETLKL
ncbi:MAG: hypothetical protein K0R02_996 [Rickettsiaceae bacterium]|jgi:hypothetical protein|nr:hypothetical protein [Rickettsiaceae bacterium]